MVYIKRYFFYICFILRAVLESFIYSFTVFIMHNSKKSSGKNLRGRKKGQFKQGFDERRVKVKGGRWSNEKVESRITRMSAGDYRSIISKSKNSTVLMCGATDRKVPQTMILRPSTEKPSLTDSILLSTNNENTKETYRVLHLGKTATMFHDSYAGHSLWRSTCNGKLEFDMTYDIQWGFAWRERLLCKMCGFVGEKFNLYDEVSARKAGAKAADINLSVASGLMDTKTGPSDLRYLIMCLQIPPPSYCAIQKHCNFAAEKVETVAAASFTRARQQVQRTNVACGFDATEPILAGIDSQYNNRLQSAGLNTPMQPATQVSTSIIEMQTKDKKVIGMHVSNKLCSKGDHTNCGIENGCTKNLEDTDIIGEYQNEQRTVT